MILASWADCAHVVMRARQRRLDLREQHAPMRVAIPQRMERSRLSELINDGYGQGRNDGYCPWIRIRRRLISKVSNLVVLPTPLYAWRSLHLLSGYEDRAANLALWLGAMEVREQFPAWPDPHEHPLTGLCPDRDRLLPFAPGLREIARACGIDHGVYPSTKIPFVATVDLALRLGKPPHDRLVLWSCKPLELMLEKGGERRLERLELERRYALAIGALNVVIDGSEAPRKFFARLDWFRPLHDEMLVFSGSAILEEFVAHFLHVCGSMPLNQAVRATGKRFHLTADLAHRLFRLASWIGHIDLDFMRPISMSRPIKRDGGATRKRMRMELLGWAT